VSKTNPLFSLETTPNNKENKLLKAQTKHQLTFKGSSRVTSMIKVVPEIKHAVL